MPRIRMADSFFSVANRLARAQGQAHQAAGGLRATHGRVGHLDDAVASWVRRTEQAKRDIRMIQNEGEFVVEILAGGHAESAEPVNLSGEGFEAAVLGGSKFLHT